MEWIKKLKKSSGEQLPPQTIASESTIACLDAFKSHWLQTCGVISATSSRPALIQTDQTKVTKIASISTDDVNTVRTLLEQMIFLLIDEQSSGQLLGPILEYTITQNIFQKLVDWWESASQYKEELLLNLLKIYEVLISQAQHSLLHHKQLVSPVLKLLSSPEKPRTEEVDGHIVLLLNLLCVWINRDPTLLEVFFNASDDHGPAKFLIFSLLIEYIHREGTVGQQSRDALILCMALSAENETVANYIVESSNFCPVLATGLSALYSTLPRHMEVRADDWHCLQKNDWASVPELTNFMNSFEFCNSVVEVSHRIVSDQLLEFFYNGFLVSVFGPSLHKKNPATEQNESKTSADEVVVTTAYLNLFLRSVTAPALMRCFLQFLLTHRHDSSLIINTLIQRIASNNRLALVSLSLIRTMVDLNCEDLMLQLVFRYLIPCQHILASQRRAIRDVDIYNASASRFLALTPAACLIESASKEEDILLSVTATEKNITTTTESLPQATKTENNSGSIPVQDKGNSVFHHLSPPPPLHASVSALPPFYQKSSTFGMQPAPSNANHAMSAYTVNEDLSVTVNVHSAPTNGDAVELPPQRPRTITSPSTMAEFGPDLSSQLELNTSYMDYLEDAKSSIDQCREACSGWSSAYDGLDPIEVEKKEINEVKNTKPSDRVTEVQLPSLTSAKENPTDVLSSSTSDTAMKALSATYQALNLTALAFNQHRENRSSTLPTISKPEPTEPDRQRSITTSNCTTPDVKSNNAEINTNGLGTGDSYQSKKSIEKIKAPLPVVEKRNEENSEKSDPDSESRLRSGTSATTSSVDEFFRSLMEIVPPTTREKINVNKESKIENGVKTDEDIESGIEISSEGDQQVSNKEQNLVTSDKESEQNDDTMSQLSLNTDDMTEDIDNKQSEHMGDDEDASRTYSYADDSDTEFDDTLSIASSSFYEPNDEYSPTDISVLPSLPLKVQGVPYTGPLIGNLFAKLDQMINNSLYENLLLTGIVARLAVYPQPLLRSFLLNTNMVFHPSVKSLYQVLNSARNKIDTYAAEINDFKILICRAQKYLLARGTYPFSGDARTRNSIQDKPMPVPKVKSRGLGGIFRKKKTKDANSKISLIPKLDTLLERGRRGSKEDENGTEERKETSSLFYVKQQQLQQRDKEKKLRELRTKNAVYASIVLAEFLKELAAIAQEHAVASFSG